MTKSLGNTSRSSTHLVFLLLWQRLVSLRRALATMDRGRKLLILPFGLIGIGFVFLLHYISVSVLEFMLDQGQAGQVLIKHGMTTVMGGIFFLLVVSTTITALTTMFRTNENSWLFSQPLSPVIIFCYKAIETGIYSAWIMLLLAVPILVALSQVLAAGLQTIAILSTGLVLLFALASLVGVLLAVLINRLLPAVQKFWWLALPLAGFWSVRYLWIQRQAETSTLLPDLNSFGAIQNYLQGLQTSSPLMPSNWFTLSFFESLQSSFSSGLYWLGLLCSTFLFFTEILLLLAYFVYQNFWWYDWGQGRRHRKRKQVSFRLFDMKSTLLSLLGKDLKIFVRDTRQWLQSITFIGLFVFLILILRQVPSRFRLMEALFGGMIAYLAFAIAGYFLTTLALRFVYPAMSLEGRSFWFLLVAPLKRKKLLQIKLIPLLLALMVLAVFLMRFVANLLHLPNLIANYSILSLLATGSVIVMLTFCVGTIWLDLKENDPAKLSSSLPAIITTLIIFGYLTMVVMLLAVPFNSYSQSVLADGYFDRSLADTLIATIVASALVIDVFLWQISRRQFEKRDF